MNVTRPDVREPQCCSCTYHDSLNQLLSALVTVLARVILLLGRCVLGLLCVDTRGRHARCQLVRKRPGRCSTCQVWRALILGSSTLGILTYDAERFHERLGLCMNLANDQCAVLTPDSDSYIEP